MADRFKLVLEDGTKVGTSDPATAVRLKAHGATEAPRSEKVDDAIDKAKKA